MRRIAIAILFAAAAVIGAAQSTDNTVYAKNFPGTTVYDKAFAARGACPIPGTVPCIIVLDPSLAAFPAGLTPLPLLETNEYYLDYRTGPPANAALDGAITNGGGYINSSLPIKVGTSVFASGQGIWHRKGTVIWPWPTVGNSSTAEIALLSTGPEGNCQVLLSPVMKCWKAYVTVGSGGLFYLESADGLRNWTWYSSAGIGGTPTAIITGCYHSSAIEPGGPGSYSYIIFCGTGANNILEYKAATAAAVLSPTSQGTVLTGGSTAFANTNEAIDGNGTMYLFVDTGGAGQTWTASSPYTTFAFANNATPGGAYYGCPTKPMFDSVTNLWYMLWTIPQTGPNQTYSSVTILMSSSTIGGPYAFVSDVAVPETFMEGVNQSFSQVVDPEWVIDHTNPQGDKIRMYYTAGNMNTFGMVNLMIADMPLSSFVRTQNWVDDGSLETENPFGWEYVQAGTPKSVNLNGTGLNGVGPETVASETLNGAFAQTTGTFSINNVLTSSAFTEILSPAGQPLYLCSNGSATANCLEYLTSYALRPVTDNQSSLGISGGRWSEVYSAGYYLQNTVAATPTTCTPPSSFNIQWPYYNGSASVFNTIAMNPGCQTGTNGGTSLNFANSVTTLPLNITVNGNFQSLGIAQTSGNITASSGWGSPVISAVTGAQRFQFTLTTAGSGQTANPTFSATFATPFNNAAPLCRATMVGGSGTYAPIYSGAATTTATGTFVYQGTPPSAADTYIIQVDCR